MIDGTTIVKNTILEDASAGLVAYFLDEEAVDIAVRGLLELNLDPIPLNNKEWVFVPINKEEFDMAIEKLRKLGFEPMTMPVDRQYTDIFIFVR